MSIEKNKIGKYLMDCILPTSDNKWVHLIQLDMSLPLQWYGFPDLISGLLRLGFHLGSNWSRCIFEFYILIHKNQMHRKDRVALVRKTIAKQVQWLNYTKSLSFWIQVLLESRHQCTWYKWKQIRSRMLVCQIIWNIKH